MAKSDGKRWPGFLAFEISRSREGSEQTGGTESLREKTIGARTIRSREQLYDTRKHEVRYKEA